MTFRSVADCHNLQTVEPNADASCTVIIKLVCEGRVGLEKFAHEVLWFQLFKIIPDCIAVHVAAYDVYRKP